MQRALFARLLLQDVPVILLDEPFTAINAKRPPTCSTSCAARVTKSAAVVAVLHDLDVVNALSRDTAHQAMLFLFFC